MNAFPVRLFHAIVSGLVLGTLLCIAGLQLFQRSVAQETGGGTSGSSGQTIPPSLPPSSPALNPTPDDLDGDGMPNAWEIQFHHEPDHASDAASDFDHDGLTALQEYQLSVSSSGVSGNPLGQWAAETLQPPAELGIQYFYPQDINRNGEILLNCGMITDGVWHDGSVVVDVEGNWTVIHNPDSSSADFIWCSDLNDNGQVAGSWYSSDWTNYEGFIWSSAEGYEALMLEGGRAFPSRVNNHGDWVGSVEDGSGNWTPAYVVDGVNMHSDRDWWHYAWYQDINDFGEALGSYYAAGYQSNHAFLAYGPWLHDTGLQGSEPEFDPETYSWKSALALNAWGEFTVGAGGRRDGSWTYPGYVFDGEFREIQSSRLDSYYVYPYSISDDKTVTGYGADSSWRSYGFIYRDGVTVKVNELIPAADGSNSVFISSDRRMVAPSADGQSVIVITPDQDQDGDGMPDDWEKYYGFNPSVNDSSADADNDGTSNYGEFLLRSDPNHAPVLDPNGNEIDTRPGIDTDGDGIPNVWEWENGLSYNDASDAPLDFDRDGYTNLQEFHLNTDPRGAPSYRIREIGPFPGTSSGSLSSVVLGDGVIAASHDGQTRGNVTESVFVTAKPTAATDGGQRPAAWSLLRSDSSGSFNFTPSHGIQATYLVAQAPGGASMSFFNNSSRQFVYWASPSSEPVTLSGASNENDISNLHNAKFSPSGNFLAATRTPANGSGYQPIIWKMPMSGSVTFKPVRLIPPTGVTLGDWIGLYVNDLGHVVANGMVGGQSRPILWTINETGTSVSSSILPALPGGNWASASGISNQSPPIISGTSNITGGQSRATVWSVTGTPTNLGALPGGNYSTASIISRGGKIAGISNVLIGNSLKYQPFLASCDPASSIWKLQAQGEPASSQPSVQSVNDSGEILGSYYEYTPVYRQVYCVWRHGRANPLAGLIPASSGHVLNAPVSLSPNGTLLSTTWKDGARMTVLLTPDSDTDGDGMPDAFENQHAFNAFVSNNPATDSDSDGLTDVDEYRNGTLPRNPDSDTDGMKDGWEVSWGLLPLDPSDALLDPDSDRVTNLRESQIGTTPTGMFKVETRLIDLDWSYPSVFSADDRGQIVYASQVQEGSGIDIFGLQGNSYSQDIFALSQLEGEGGVQISSLPRYFQFSGYSSDWTEYSSSYDRPTYWADAESGLVHGAMTRGSGYSGVDGSWWGETLCLIPDAINHPDEGEWIAWTDVEANLRNPDLHGGVAPMGSADSLSPSADAVSPSGTRRIHRTTNTGQCLVLNERGEFIEKLSGSSSWPKVNDDGVAARVKTRLVNAANGLPSYYAPDLQLSTGEVIPIPHEPGVSPSYTLRSFSDDGRALLSKSAKNHQFAVFTQYFLFDLASGNLSRIRSPGVGNESIDLLSLENGRLLGTGPKPFQITPDGTCIRLEALRIKNSPADTPVPFGNLYPRTLTPNHISSDGRITLTTTNSIGQTIILQIVPKNDLDDDGLMDDWVKSTTERALEGALPNAGDPALLSPNSDPDQDGLVNIHEFEAGTDPLYPDHPNVRLEIMFTSE